MSEKEEKIKAIENSLEEMNQKIDEVQKKIEKADMVKRINYNRMNSELYGLVKDVEMKLDELRNSEDGNWETLKEKAEESLEELKDSAKKTFDEMNFQE